jgi:c-di-GMP-binding flagellar brake protein YcgR
MIESMAVDQERRKHPRAKAKWSVTLETPQGVINTEIQDISLEGAFIRCLDPLPPPQTFKMVINVPQANRRLMVGSQVIWVTGHGPDHSITSRGMGVQFSEISGSDRQFLQRVIMERI